MIYLLLVNTTLMLCYLLYILFFRRLTFFQLNRIYLLGAVLVSLLIPVGLFIKVPSSWFMKETLPVIDLSSLMTEVVVMGRVSTSQISLHMLLQMLYWAGVTIGFAWLLFRLAYVAYLVGRKKSTFSFAFFHRVVLGDQDLGSPIIAAHEQVHVREGHSYDILLLEVVSVFNWFNPILYFYLKELKFQHECIADEQCSQDKVSYAELLVAQAMQVKSVHFLHEFSNQSILKNRIMMLFKDKSKTQKKWLYVTIAPVILLTALSTIVFNTSQAKALVHGLEDKVTTKNLPIGNFTMADDNDKANSSMETVSKVPLDVVPESFVEQKQDTSRQKTDENNKGGVFNNPEILAKPKQGITDFRKWVGAHYNYPQSAIDAGVKGQIIVSFIVGINGDLDDFKVVQDVGHGTGEALIEVLKTSDAWDPGIIDGRKVRTLFQLPMTLDLTP